MKALVRSSFLIAVMATTFLLADRLSGRKRSASVMERRSDKHAIVEFIRATADPSSMKSPRPRSASRFDQDGTLWASHPIYPQLMYCLDRLPAVVQGKTGACGRSNLQTALSRNMGRYQAFHEGLTRSMHAAQRHECRAV
jgi:hypothetical protein